MNKILHQLWVGKNPIPKIYYECLNSVKKLMPEWDYRFYTDIEIKALNDNELDMLLEKCINPAEQSDVLRYYIINKFGGIYADADFIFYKTLNDILVNELFCVWENPRLACFGIFGGTKNNEELTKINQHIKSRLINNDYKGPYARLGPQFVSSIIDKSKWNILPTKLFYPYGYRQKRLDVIPQECYAEHVWLKSWWPEEKRKQCVKLYNHGDLI